MKTLVFPYGIRFQENGRLETFPAAEISIGGRGGKGIRAVFLVDSGATTTIIPSDDAYMLGLNIKDGAKAAVRGLGDTTFFGYKFLLHFTLGDTAFDAPVIIVEHPGVPHILGREGIFHRFGILFDETRHRIGLLNGKKQRRVIDSLF